MDDNYCLIDSGLGRKLERFGKLLLDRPAAQAFWPKTLPESAWKKADAEFFREDKSFYWKCRRALPASWKIELEGLSLLLKATDFGHLGVFPEHRRSWELLAEFSEEIPLEERKRKNILNLFAYSGAATLLLANLGFSVTHLDSSKGMLAWAKENAKLNGLEKAPIRWIVDDVIKFLQREKRRGKLYDGVILDPPSFGRGAKGELFKIEEDIQTLLVAVRDVLTKEAQFVFLSCHSPHFSPKVLENLLRVLLVEGKFFSEELLLYPAENALKLPSGGLAVWKS